ncbi:MAG: TatD family hydrolase [Porticoccaceae bacterium]
MIDNSTYLIDSHCHLDRLVLAGDESLESVLCAARAAGVGQLLSVAVDLESARHLQGLVDQYKGLFCSVGMHPLQDQQQPLVAVEQLEQLAGHPKVVAIGETGLDNHYLSEDAQEARDWQQQSFERHLLAAKNLQLPVIVHTREARQLTLDMIEAAASPTAGVLHCFTESREMAEAAVAMGYYISLSGIVTFKNAKALQEVARWVPLERLLVETDSPWLAPVPHRGQENRPALVRDVAEFIAQLRGISLAELAAASSENFYRLFARTSAYREELL